jgi:dCMP deaminase
MIKPSWDDYFLGIMHAVAARATCDRGRSGCVITRDNHILVTGYVGAPQNFDECDKVGHMMEARCGVAAKSVEEMKLKVSDALASGNVSFHCVRTIHAEANAILQAAKTGIALEGATLYCSMTPCRVCAMSIIRVSIVRVVCEKKYHLGAFSEEMFTQAHVKLVYKSDEVMKY